MPRRARLAVAGIPWHIIQRGNNRSTCFFAEQDHRYYLKTLTEQSALHGCNIHAYCLMTNHVHLLLTPDTAEAPSLMMKNLGQRYVQYVNATYGRSGTLWEGRFKSCLAQDEGYALCCYRYIELNPVRAGMVENPGDYYWSSFRCNALGTSSELLSPHSHYLALGKTKVDRCRKYVELVSHQLMEDEISEIRLATQGNHAIGSESFINELTSKLGRRVTRGKAGRPGCI